MLDPRPWVGRVAEDHEEDVHVAVTIGSMLEHHSFLLGAETRVSGPVSEALILQGAPITWRYEPRPDYREFGEEGSGA